MAHGWAICLVLFFVLEIQARSKNSYSCAIGRANNSTNKCNVSVSDPSWTRQRKTKLTKPTNCKIVFYLRSVVKSEINCSIRAKIKFEYKGLQHDENDLEGFLITIPRNGGYKYYNVTLPTDYNKAIGGNFTVNLKTFNYVSTLTDNELYSFRVGALPHSKECRKKKKLVCVSEEEYTKSGCNSSRIRICRRDRTFIDTTTDNFTEVTPVTSSTETPTTIPSTLIISLILAFSFATTIIIATAFVRKCQWKPQKKRAVLLASSGDNTSQFTDLANQIASELESSGQFENVFFSGWLRVNELEKNLEKLHDALHHATVVILFSSPFGRTSYEKFIEKGQLATWKDEFVIGAHSLLRKQRHHVIMNHVTAKKILVVYYNNDDADRHLKSDFLHEDFVTRANKLYNLADPHDNSSLYKELLSSHHGNKYKTVSTSSDDVCMNHFT